MASMVRDTDRTEWHELTADGSFVLRKRQKSHGKDALTDAAVAALAFNDICCEMGVGMFYLLVSHKDWAEYPEATRIDMKSVPELFYFPEAWTETDRRKWRDQGWNWQYARICARNGWLADHVPVLPLRLQVDRKRCLRPRFDAQTRAPILIYCAPKLYAAPVADIAKLSLMAAATSNRYDYKLAIRGQTDDSRWEKMEQWRLDTPEDLMRYVEGQFWAGAHEGWTLTEWYASLTHFLQDFEIADESLIRAVAVSNEDDLGTTDMPDEA